MLMFVLLTTEFERNVFMKGVVFSFKGSSFVRPHFRGLSKSDIKYFCKRYLKHCAFVLLLLVGLAVGSVFAGKADEQLMNSLDFLFTTNISARLEQDVFGTFCACFASDFVFFFTIFLLGMAPWGIPVIPFVILFKGFGIGITAGYLVSLHSLAGVGFYLLIILPGTFLFCFALVLLSVNSIYFSAKIFRQVIGKANQNTVLSESLKKYMSQAMTVLIMTFCAAILDTVLWLMFSGAFKF